MKIRFVCQEPRWEMTDDVHLDPPRCGGSGVISVEPARWEQGRVEAVCPACRHTTYSDVSAFEVIDHEMPVAVGVLAVNGEWVLGVSRKDNHTAFGVPGGKVDPTDGELSPLAFAATLRRAAVREFREETGITLEPEQLDFFYQGVCPGGSDGIAYWMVTLQVRDGVALAAPVSQPGEGVVKWVSWETLLGGPFGGYNGRLRGELTRDLFDLEDEREYMATRIYDSLGIPLENREP